MQNNVWVVLEYYFHPLVPIFNRINSNFFKLLRYHLLMLIFVCSLFLPVYADAGQAAKVLIINSYHPGFKWTDDIVLGIKSVLNKNEDLRIEYMDTRRVFTREYLDNLYQSFRIKLKNERYDVIIVTDDPALELVIPLHKELFPATPVVFCGINDFTDAKLKGETLYTGVVEDIDLKRTIELIHKLHPKAARIIAPVNTNATGLANRRLLEKTIPAFKGIFNVEIVPDPKITSFLEQLRDLPKDEYIILLMGRFKSMQGEDIPLNASTPQIAQTGFPIYSLWDFYLGHGIIGGRLTSGFYQGKTAGEIARRILNGERNIPIVRESPNVYMFDFQELRRFGLDINLLPEGSILINRPLSFYTRYRDAIRVAAVITLLSFIVIAFLAIIILQKNKVQRELHGYKTNLESMVEKRTSELNAANKALTTEITERRRAEDELQRTNRLLSVILNNSTAGIALVKNRVFEWINPRLSEMFGVTPEQCLGASTRIIYLDDESFNKIGSEIYPLLAQGKKATLEIEMRKSDESSFWCHMEAKALDASNLEDGIIWTLEDVTERRRAEDELQKTNRLLSVILDNSPAGISLVRNRVFEWVNPRMLELYGLSQAECLGASTRIIYLDDESYNTIGAEAYAILAQGKKASIELEMRKGANSSFWCRLEGKALDASNLQEGTIWTAEDITERKMAEDDLRKAHRLLSVILDNSPAGIALVRNRVFEWVNPRMPELFGISPEQCLGVSTRIIYLDDESFRKMYEEAAPLLLQGKKATIEMEMRRGSDSSFWCRLEGKALDPSNLEEGVIWTAEDITERKMVEKERLQHIAQLQQALSEIKTLSGLLPICTSCKKIRDDKGYWNQIEGYIAKHSGAEFTHGLCPECTKKLYPDFYNKILDKK